MKISIGVTGTRNRVTNEQIEKVEASFFKLRNWSVQMHHGDCVGADKVFYDIAKKYGFYTISHPPTIQAYRAFTTNDEEREPEPFLIRNHSIVKESSWLIGLPNTYDYVPHSGTWATINYAQRLKRPLHLIYPDGSMLMENMP